MACYSAYNKIFFSRAIVSFGLLPVNVFLFDPVRIKVLISAMIALLILVRHIGNIERLIKGAERKIENVPGAVKNQKFSRDEMKGI